jgi:CheY-like chemotaxis protein
VDDDRDVIEALQSMLERLGHSVTLADGAIAALACFDDDPGAIDVVVTDHAMPDMTGLHLAEELLRRSPQLGIVLITGFGDPELAAQAIATGISRVVAKPCTQAELGMAIAESYAARHGQPRQ